MRKTILVVEDFREISEMYQRALDAAGYEVACAGTASDALNILNTHPPDLVVLDLGLPDMSGWHLLQSMRVTPNLQDIPVIIVTADTRQASVALGWSLGCVSYVTKPLLVSDLLLLISRVLEPAAVPLAVSA